MSSRAARRLLPGLSLLALGLTLTACSGQTAGAGAQNLLNAAVSTRGLEVTRDQRYGPDARNVLDVYAPQDARNAPVVLFVHGGSWQNGDKEGHKFVGESLARAGYVTGVMNYRLAPQNRYPAYIQDTAAALRWMRDHAAKLGGNPDSLFVTGHSAGAFNAVEAVVNERWLREAGVPIRAVRGVIGIAGPYSYDFRDFQSRVAFPEGGTPDEIMPDRHVRPDAPPHLLLVAENDTTVHPQNALNMEAALKRAGVPVTRTVIPRVNHITIVGALARPLTFLGGTRQQVIDFIEKNRVR
ncbi:acetyl esterase/lipase [Deinococcus sp. HSC-46F16]|uniref:alpha/beta hydrolase n=1 Tax=Deinococcus sp. HSC-46F16 TaxID=2910968 RepID=UPI00209E6F85|nr:alpha/beta hydrolase [Deinococcus sp. HSC-46F16]MCP2013245.1 acetyl esterase/lipase [Deinococcus sp. HSC-46F16]